MNFYQRNKKKPWMGNAIALCIAIFFYLFLSRLGTIVKGVGAFLGFVSPVFLGIVFAYIMNPMARLVQKYVLGRVKDERRSWVASTLITIVVVILLVTLFLATVIPQIVESVISLINNMGSYARSLSRMVSELSETAASNKIDISQLAEAVQNFINTVAGYVSAHSGTIINTVTNVGTNVVNGVISFILAVYFLMDKKRLQKGITKFLYLLMSDTAYKNLRSVGSKSNDILVRYVWCDLLDGLIIGCTNAIFMAIAGMPNIALVSVVVGVTNLAPTFGPIVGAVVGTFVLVLSNPWHALAFLIFTVILQTLDGYILKPKMFGGLLGVPGIMILIMIIIGGRMFGVVGILLAIPVAAILDYLYDAYLMPYLEKRKETRRKAAEADLKNIRDEK